MQDSELPTPAMIRAARALLGFDQSKIAQKAGVAQRTISKLEAQADFSSLDKRRREVLTAIKEALEREGIEFIFPDTISGPGVRMKGHGTDKR